MSGSTGTARTLSYLLSQLFEDGQSLGAISPQDMRDFVVSTGVPAATALTYGSTIATDCSTGPSFSVTLTGTTALLASPINMRAGMTYTWIISQDATGGRRLTWGSQWKFAAGIPPQLSSGPRQTDMVTGYSDGTTLYATSILNFVAAPTSSLQFATNFGPSVSLGATPPGYDWQLFSGQDRGFSFTGGPFGGVVVLQVAIDPGDAMANTIVNIAGPFGPNVYALQMNVTISDAPGPTYGVTQDQFLTQITTSSQAAALNSGSEKCYYRLYRKFPSNLVSVMAADAPNTNFQVVSEIKTGGNGGLFGGDYRLIVTVFYEGSAPNLYWNIKADNVANGGLTTATFWTLNNKTVAVPVGSWFAFEFFWDRPNARVWMSINGVNVYDINGQTMYGQDNQMINRIFWADNYGNAINEQITLFEVYDDFPADASVNGTSAMTTTWWTG